MSEYSKELATPQELKYLNSLTKLLDNQFRIPGTNIQFGLDFLIGLIPYAGDLLSFLLSGGLVIAMVKHGASGKVVAKMLWNIILDTTVGSIPIIGDIFDLQYKANRRNYHLLQEHYQEGKHKGNVWTVLIAVLIILILLFVLMIWVVWKLTMFTFDWIF